jgi:NADH-quinone oxidoreductase subunit H
MTPELKGYILVSVLKLLVIFTITMVAVAYMTLMERKVSAWMQNRLGPNRIGPGGLLQPVADGIKNLIKEETFPTTASGALFFIAPCMAFVPALIISCVIPWAAPLPLTFDVTLPVLGQVTHAGTTPIAITDLPVGFLYVLAITSLGVYGIALAGWASNSKYSLIGGLRAAAQMVSYEVAMGLSIVPVLLLVGNVSFSALVDAQHRGWYIVPLSLGFILFFVSGFAETNRAPFDLPEAESELVAGYHTEYSAFKFSMFFIAEYANVLTSCAMTVSLFLGGWDIPFTSWDETPGVWQTLATGAAMAVKTSALIFVVMWVRWTLPRFRYDQLMALGWKFMLPVALGYIVVVTTTLYALPRVAGITSPLGVLLGLAAVSAVLVFLLVVVLDRGILLKGSGPRRMDRPLLAGRMRPAAVRGEG